MSNFNGQALKGAEHPALSAAKSRLETLERRTPPGYPLGYSLHVVRWTCLGCGGQGSHDTLWTIYRAGSAGKSYHVSHRGEKLYELPVEFVKRTETTLRCSACIGKLAREPVPALPAYRALLGPSRPKQTSVEEIDLKALGLLDD